MPQSTPSLHDDDAAVEEPSTTTSPKPTRRDEEVEEVWSGDNVEEEECRIILGIEEENGADKGSLTSATIDQQPFLNHSSCVTTSRWWQ
ncbi:hypothetical protein Vadar_010996 [Vaccinium darrowii]|uniref:Uncharacterized protein n=1 Tax=Vaccinium darrowii TaxID=229202 RepID=A0ACB7ZJI5_9ERIC|nr:hypothetical protein Vadar_010996 [Vaccinium darrowii]